MGDGNNIVYSLIEASVKFDFELAIACPKKLKPNKKIIDWAKKNKSKNIDYTWTQRSSGFSWLCDDW